MSMSVGPYKRQARRREFFGLVHQWTPLAASAVQTPDDIAIDGQSDVLVHARAAIYTDGQARVRFERVPGRMESTVEFDVSALGSGLFPKYLPTPQLISRGSIYRALASDRQTVVAANTIRILHLAQKVYDSPFEPGKMFHGTEPFAYVADFTTQGIGAIAASGSLMFATPIDSEADFDVYQVSIIADFDATIEIETSGKALKWFSEPCHIGLLGASNPNAAISSGARPFRLPSPVMVAAGGTILTTVNNLNTVNANRVQVIYEGVKLSPPGGVPFHEQY